MIFKTLNFILSHPLNQNRRVRALLNWLKWQIGSRLVSGPVLVPFVQDTSLFMKPGLLGVTGNLYTGLHEFEEMAFLIHFLQENDLFVDVGANCGSYTVLAAGVAKAKCLSIEPVPGTFQWLVRNIIVNNLTDKVKTVQMGVGGEKGVLKFTASLDTTNHTIEGASGGNQGQSIIEVPVDTLDNLIVSDRPALMKMDIEGYELHALSGARNMLSSNTLLGAIVEVNDNCLRYGIHQADIYKKMESFGFEAFQYDAFTRSLSHPGSKKISDNVLFLRNLDEINRRLKNALPFKIFGRQI